jgi:tetratricopeptide (TPR) repeat protein
MAFRNRGGTICVGLLVCSLNATALSATNVPPAAIRSPDEKNAVFSLAVQLVQKIQSQQQSILSVLDQTHQQNAATLAMLRRVTILLVSLLVVIIAAVVLIIGRVFRVGHAREAAGDAPSAVSEAVRAAHVDLLLAKGDALVDLKQPAQALVCYEQALALDGNSADALARKQKALELAGAALTK